MKIQNKTLFIILIFCALIIYLSALAFASSTNLYAEPYTKSVLVFNQFLR